MVPWQEFSNLFVIAHRLHEVPLVPALVQEEFGLLLVCGSSDRAMGPSGSHHRWHSSTGPIAPSLLPGWATHLGPPGGYGRWGIQAACEHPIPVEPGPVSSVDAWSMLSSRQSQGLNYRIPKLFQHCPCNFPRVPGVGCQAESF